MNQAYTKIWQNARKLCHTVFKYYATVLPTGSCLGTWAEDAASLYSVNTSSAPSDDAIAYLIAHHCPLT